MLPSGHNWSRLGRTVKLLAPVSEQFKWHDKCKNLQTHLGSLHFSGDLLPTARHLGNLLPKRQSTVSWLRDGGPGTAAGVMR
jgi:hypothetical protein